MCFASEIELWNILHSPLSPFDLVKPVMEEYDAFVSHLDVSGFPPSSF